jgi:AraC-like DNA-binding protein
MASGIPLRLLDAFPLTRSRNADEASAHVARVFSPHKLEVLGHARTLDMCHNHLRMRDLSLNFLSYGCDVAIKLEDRGDYFMVQLPLSGHALVSSKSAQVQSNSNVLTVLEPRASSHMVWSGDCSMLMLQVPRAVAEERMHDWRRGSQLRVSLARTRSEPDVAAWWQAMFDLACNLDRFGEQWRRHPAAYAAMEDFILSGFTSIFYEKPEATAVERVDERSLRMAKEYILDNLNRSLTVTEIARHACVSPRTLEAAFKRHGEASPMAYARQQRLQKVHQRLRDASQSGYSLNIAEIAMSYGFVHMSRFAAQYREQFGCTPSETLRPH